MSGKALWGAFRPLMSSVYLRNFGANLLGRIAVVIPGLLAARIQNLTNRFQCDILVTEDTMRRLGPFDLEKLPPGPVRGYSKPVTAYPLAQG